MVLLFFAGGPIVGEAMPDSSPAPTAAAALDEPDIVGADGPVPDARLLFRDPDGDEVSTLTASVVGG